MKRKRKRSEVESFGESDFLHERSISKFSIYVQTNVIFVSLANERGNVPRLSPAGCWLTMKALPALALVLAAAVLSSASTLQRVKRGKMGFP